MEHSCIDTKMAPLWGPGDRRMTGVRRGRQSCLKACVWRAFGVILTCVWRVSGVISERGAHLDAVLAALHLALQPALLLALLAQAALEQVLLLPHALHVPLQLQHAPLALRRQRGQLRSVALPLLQHLRAGEGDAQIPPANGYVRATH